MILDHRMCECETCFYCDAYLARRHDHDHFPVPTCCNGTETVPACLNCHELKDRIPLEHWPVNLYGAALVELTAQGMATADPHGAVEQLGDVVGRWETLRQPGRLLYAKLRFIAASDDSMYPTTLF